MREVGGAEGGTGTWIRRGGMREMVAQMGNLIYCSPLAYLGLNTSILSDIALRFPYFPLSSPLSSSSPP